jgi:hypothetical protein
VNHGLYGRAILFGWSAIKFLWYGALMLILFYFAYEIAESYDREAAKPTKLEMLCAELQALYDDMNSDADREKLKTPTDHKIEDIYLDHCPG